MRIETRMRWILLREEEAATQASACHNCWHAQNTKRGYDGLTQWNLQGYVDGLKCAEYDPQIQYTCTNEKNDRL